VEQPLGSRTGGNCSESGAALRTWPHVVAASRRITTSRHANVKELRGKVNERHLGVPFAFDPRRAAVLLIGGDKTGDPKWHERFVPLADDLFDQHLKMIERERRK
jgi:hypothetical protein